MKIVIEGMRGTGKTTLIAHLKESLENDTHFDGYVKTIWKAKRGRVPTIDMIKSIYGVEFRDPVEIVLIDRFHLSELVNSIIGKRRDPYRLLTETREIDTLFRDIHDVAVYVLTCTEPTRQKRLEGVKRKDDFDQEKARRMWGKVIQSDMVQAVFMHENETDTEKIVEYIISELKEWWKL